VAYVTRTGSQELVLVDGQSGARYDALGQDFAVFSPDCKRVGYGAKKGTRWIVVIDGQEGKKYSGIVKGPPISDLQSG
jgi:hypothetical protein